MLTTQRHIIPEIMDRPDVNVADHAEALAGLRRINAASKAAEKIAAPIIRLARRKNLHRLSMLDIACGGGDVPLSVAKLARKFGIEIDLTFLDRSQTALNLAAAAANNARIQSRSICADLMDDWNHSNFDVVTCSLFLHHVLQPDRVVQLLQRMRTIARHIVVISDLRRSPLGLFVAFAGSRILSPSAIVHHDAPASVRAAWTLRELTDFAARASLTRARVHRCFPWRMLLIWENPGSMP